MEKNILSLQPDVDGLITDFDGIEGFDEAHDAHINNPQPDDFEVATAEDKAYYTAMRPSVTSLQEAWRALKRNTVAMAALVVLIAIQLFAFAGPMIVPYSYDQQIRGSENLGIMKYSESELARIEAGESVFPHVFGTDNLGRDIMARVMFGTRISTIVGVFASLIVLVIGTLYGAISGYFGGTVDLIMMRIVEIIYSLPEILMVLLISAVIKEPIKAWINSSDSFLATFCATLGHGIIAIFIAFGLLYWVGMARIIRGEVLMLKQQEYITAARALGASSGRIIIKHLLPNCIGQIIAVTMMQIPAAIFLESFLSYLGMGVSAPADTLGSLAADALGGIYTYPARLVIPSAFLCALILSFNLFGDGLRDALDPRMKKQ
jgi:oligopeptide transport system permease protein